MIPGTFRITDTRASWRTPPSRRVLRARLARFRDRHGFDGIVLAVLLLVWLLLLVVLMLGAVNGIFSAVTGTPLVADRVVAVLLLVGVVGGGVYLVFGYRDGVTVHPRDGLRLFGDDPRAFQVEMERMGGKWTPGRLVADMERINRLRAEDGFDGVGDRKVAQVTGRWSAVRRAAARR